MHTGRIRLTVNERSRATMASAGRCGCLQALVTSRIHRATTSLAAAAVVVLALTSCAASPTTSFRSKAVKDYVTTALDFMSSYGLNAGSPSWSAARSKTIAATSGDAQISQTHTSLRAAVAVAGDPRHSAFQSRGTTSGTKARTVAQQIPTTASLGNGATMITLPTHIAGTENDSAYVSAGATSILAADPSTSCGWVVDLRGNQGGDVYPMLAALSPLLAQGHVISFVDRHHRATWVSLAGSTISYRGTKVEGDIAVTAPAGGSSASTKPIAILQSPETASSAEAVVLALLAQKNSRTFGQTTAGLASANVSKTLSDGSVIVLTSAWTSNASGATYPNGIPVETRTSTDQSTIEAATAWIRSQCGG